MFNENFFFSIFRRIFKRLLFLPCFFFMNLMIFSALALFENLIWFIVFLIKIKSILFFIFFFPNYVYGTLRLFFIYFFFIWTCIFLEVFLFTFIILRHFSVIYIIGGLYTFWFFYIKFFWKNLFFLFHKICLLFDFHFSCLSFMKFRFHNYLSILIKFGNNLFLTLLIDKIFWIIFIIRFFYFVVFFFLFFILKWLFINVFILFEVLLIWHTFLLLSPNFCIFIIILFFLKIRLLISKKLPGWWLIKNRHFEIILVVWSQYINILFYLFDFWNEPIK